MSLKQQLTYPCKANEPKLKALTKWGFDETLFYNT